MYEIYISLLDVPEHMEKNVICVSEAPSMAAGYNAAMKASDARYKVYLHQDVFIINKKFIYDVLGIFKKHPDYGMLGVVGSTEKIKDANYWEKWDVGVTYANDGLQQVVTKTTPIETVDVKSVASIDGMIMITQYDVLWREDICDGFDFYDISQAEEFKKAGYKIGVVHQKDIWCNHDCGPSNLLRYDEYREKFCEMYREEGYRYEICERNKREQLNAETQRKQLLSYGRSKGND